LQQIDNEVSRLKGAIDSLNKIKKAVSLLEFEFEIADLKDEEKFADIKLKLR
ncbi:MAG: DUF2443 domain-containing protein, partial [Lachnospiraceae bacterium]|nr:DUF2443 domain-containing protein [Lachnospiraceae bacterium]